jgi:hypothetical protein
MKKITQLLILSIFIIACGGREFPEIVNVDSLEKTDFVSTLDEKMKLDQNQIYCSTLPYAWFEIREELKDKIESDSKSIIQLNEADDYQNSLAPHEISTSVEVEAGVIKASAYFRKSLPFTLEFIRNKYDLKFNETEVESFGLRGYEEFDVTKQIKIIDYKNDNDFLLKLLPKDSTHEIFIYLPKKNNFKNLSEVIKSIQKRVNKSEKDKINDKNQWKHEFLEDDIFSMPVLSYNIEKNYHDIAGQTFNVNEQDYSVDVCYQRIAFILDEAGAEIESEAEVEMTTEEGLEESKSQPKNLILNQPFFIMLKRTDSDNPYLAMWIENEELMIKK